MKLGIFRDFSYRLAGMLIKVARKYREYIDSKNHNRIKEEEKLTWDRKFDGNDFFLFKIDENLEMKLFRDSVLSKLIYKGFEVDETSFVKLLLNEGDVFVDIGANVGLFSLIASQKVGASGMVISFEPTPVTFERLQENINLNHLKNIDARRVALSDQAGSMDFYISENGHDAWNSLAPSKDSKLQKVINVPVSTLDEELNSVDKSKVRLIKIDVEGWEKFTLMGGENFLKEYEPILLIEFTDQNTFNAGYMVQDIYMLLEKWGYAWYKISNGELVPDPLRIKYPYNNLVAKKK